MFKTSFLIAFTLASTGALAAESGRMCGIERTSGDKVCYRYYPTRALEMTSKDGSSKTEFPISEESAKVKYDGDLTIDTYEFKPAEKGKTLVVTSRVMEPGRYPGDGEWEMVSLAGETPGRHSEKFSVKLSK